MLAIYAHGSAGIYRSAWGSCLFLRGYLVVPAQFENLGELVKNTIFVA